MVAANDEQLSECHEAVEKQHQRQVSLCTGPCMRVDLIATPCAFARTAGDCLFTNAFATLIYAKSCCILKLIQLRLCNIARLKNGA